MVSLRVYFDPNDLGALSAYVWPEALGLSAAAMAIAQQRLQEALAKGNYNKQSVRTFLVIQLTEEEAAS